MAKKKVIKHTLTECGQNRVTSRSVSWNATGSYLAVASSDRMTRLVDVSGREVLVVSGHTGPVLKARFHPNETTLLCTAATDGTARLFDVRGATQRAVGQISVQYPVDMDWCPDSRILAIAERDGSVHLYDTRKLSSVAVNTSTSANRNQHHKSALHSFTHQGLVESCVFAPSGQHLVAGSTVRGKGMGYLRIFPWKEPEHEASSYPAHAGPICALAFSPNGRHLATAGVDALVGIWDPETMCCQATVANKTKYIRTVAFSHDSQCLAVASEEDMIEIVDSSGRSMGTVPTSSRPRSGGAEEVAWHPKDYILAAARINTGMLAAPPVTIAKLNIQ